MQNQGNRCIESRCLPTDMAHKMSSVLLFLLTVNLATVLSVSKPLSPRMFADPGVDPVILAGWHNISCVGQNYDLSLPLHVGWNPNNVSMQHLCAKTKYGGGPEDQNIGGWCDHNEVVFDYKHIAQLNNPKLSVPRVQLGCRLRCFCNHNIPVEQRSVQPKASEDQVSLKVGSKQSSQTHELRLDVVDDFTFIGFWARKGRQGSEMVPSVRLTHVMESEMYEDLFRARYHYVTQDPGNSISCSGPLPTFSLPQPYATSDFENLQQMCAVQLGGGLLGANAGGFCYRSDAIDNGGRTVWFADDMTPRLDWTWGGGNFFASASIRSHCVRYCHCTSSSGSTTNVTYLDNLWNFVGGAQLAIRPSGQVDLLSAKNVPPKIILPAQNGPGSASGTCGADGKQFCPQKWPTSLLGPVPRAPPNATDVVRPGPNPGVNNNLTTCGNTCQGPQDCGGGDDEKACACAIPNAKDAKVLGLDPVFPAAVCLVLLHSNFGGKGQLIGREVEQPWRCLCNATFVHSDCCGSRDGMVWID